MATITWPRGSSNAKEPDVSGKAVAPVMTGATAAGGAPIKLQRSPKKIALSVLLIALSALGFAWYATAYRHTTDVVTVRQAVDRGEVIKREDLQSASITLDPALRTIPKSEIDSLVGKRAASDLHPGTIVAPDQVSAANFPAKGASVVGLYLASSQMPHTPLRPASVVRLIATPKAGDDASAAKAQSVSYTATVVGVKQMPDNSHVIVDVLVPTDQAGPVAALDATQRLALVLDGV